ncbi:NF038120 family PEP-CTERM protein [Rugamonas sp.]|uniref:NF038120 family PEP-CTERM protein n=1 Tax=Rugamonas sp. TaxID=1926287 RepID=UPI0025DBC89A|nr:NF038120 family PEP-CTERM protein [Rugamonas sp.]
MMTKIRPALLAGLCTTIGLLAAMPAHADMLTFNSQKPDVFVGGDSFTEAGYLMQVLEGPYTAANGISSTSGAILDPRDPFSCEVASCPAGDGSQYYAGLGDGGVTLSRADGKGFVLNSLQYAFLAPYAMSDGSYGKLQMSAVTMDGHAFSLSVPFLGQDGNGNFLYNTLPFNLGAGGTGLSSLTFNACFYGDDGVCVNSLDQPAYGQAQFALDNLQVSTVAAVPEPGTWGMLLAGLALVGAVSRLRRRRPSTPDATGGRV